MKKALAFGLAFALGAPALSVHALTVAVDCSKKTLTSAIQRLDNTVPNVLNISGSCNEDVVVSRFADLTLVGVAGASITPATGAAASGTTLLVSDGSRITVEALTINGAAVQAVSCTGRSSCVFRNVTVQGGGAGIQLQDQSSAEILGASAIKDSTGNGVGVFGASTVNIRPEPWTGEEVGPVISGHKLTECTNPNDPNSCVTSGAGAYVQDGSFLRTDNVTFSGNGTGIVAQRNAVIKIYTENAQNNIGGVRNNVNHGIVARWQATASVSGPISGNGGWGVVVGALSFYQPTGTVLFSGNTLGDVQCQGSTSFSQPPNICGHF